ncbi:hypothetical protein SVIOM74S_04819 [Streptomyces violarus]
MPSLRAAAAGKSLCRSGVAVNQMLDQVLGGEVVALQDGREQGPHLLVHVPGLVPFELDGAPDRSYRHGDAPC